MYELVVVLAVEEEAPLRLRNSFESDVPRSELLGAQAGFGQ